MGDAGSRQLDLSLLQKTQIIITNHTLRRKTDIAACLISERSFKLATVRQILQDHGGAVRDADDGMASLLTH